MDQLEVSTRNAYVRFDHYSRKIVGSEIYESESSEQLKRVVKRAIARENMAPKVIHSDNGSPMKGWSLVEYLYELDVNISRSRPRVSNDNGVAPCRSSREVKYFSRYPYFRVCNH
ncbi:MAG: DDE-type integrase/transposase/recombinase [Actinomycetota bacterium]|nr:DDE-type integrase/transposase/recombinase [Actinomycetota bacterium]